MTQIRSLVDFAGTWQVSRRISPASGPAAVFEGTAVWSAAQHGLAYHETGLMTLEAHPAMQAEQRYFWTPDLSVFFEDGRFFHTVPRAGGTAQHFCDPDTYVARYDFGSWPRFKVIWDVKGPRKDYRSITEYTRC